MTEKEIKRLLKEVDKARKTEANGENAFLEKLTMEEVRDLWEVMD